MFCFVDICDDLRINLQQNRYNDANVSNLFLFLVFTYLTFSLDYTFAVP